MWQNRLRLVDYYELHRLIVQLSSLDGSISTLGLSTAKNIIVGDTTDASSSTTGSLKTAGGLGVAKKAFVGDTVSIATTAANAELQLSNSVVNRKIILFEATANDHQYYGFGVNSSVFRYQVGGTSANHVFYAGVNSTTSNELMRITGGAVDN